MITTTALEKLAGRNTWQGISCLFIKIVRDTDILMWMSSNSKYDLKMYNL